MMETTFGTAAAARAASTAAGRVRKACTSLRSAADVVHLRLRNRLALRPVTGTADVVVSMSTHGRRFDTVDLALESIARGTVRPRRLILWVDDPALLLEQRAALRRLQRRGLEIRLSRSFGPHTKYYPLVAGARCPVQPLVTADDDIIYPASWLGRLVEANRQYPDMVNAYCVKVIGVNAGSITQYEAWPRRHDTRPGLNNLARGDSGIIYPTALLRELRDRGDLFMDVCPGADDLWRHWVALRARIPTRQLGALPRRFPVIPGSQAADCGVNRLRRSHRDRWIRRLYSSADVAAMAASRRIAPWDN